MSANPSRWSSPRPAPAAQDAAEHVIVDYEALPAVTDAIAALTPGAPLIHDSVSGNLAVEAEFGDRAAADAAFAAAALVVSQTFRNQRIASAQMEPRSALAAYDAAKGLFTIQTCSQGAVRIKAGIAACLGVTPERVRVITGDVGGAFGLLSNAYCEQVMVAFAARHVGRPVKWTNSRSEAFLTDYQGRDIATEGRLALDADGRILALSVAMTGNIGAHAVTYVPLSNAYRVTPTVYDIPVAAVTIRGALTNTVPTAPFRGAGRPEATFVIERLIDIAARRLGIDRIALRRRNLIRRAQLPYRSATGLVYDSGNFRANMDAVVEARGLVGISGPPPRRRQARPARRHRHRQLRRVPGRPAQRACRGQRARRRRRRGRGRHPVERPGPRDELRPGARRPARHRAAGREAGDRRHRGGGGGRRHPFRSLHADRRHAAGRGLGRHHRRRRAKCSRRSQAARRARWNSPMASSSRRAPTAGSMSSTSPAPSRPMRRCRRSLRAPLKSAASFVGRIPAYPTGAAVCEVEVDPQTGLVSICRYTSVDDSGQPINPLILHGQVHGGIVQGAGQALCEAVVHDAAGQALAGSFMDYAMPRASMVPRFTVALTEDPTKGNPLRVKGGGEAGITPALAVIMNAVIDALSPHGIEHMDMPATPARVWEAIRAAKG